MTRGARHSCGDSADESLYTNEIHASLFLVLGALCAAAPIMPAQTSRPAAPRLHHVGLNTVDPERAIAWYLKVWPSAKRTTVAGFPAVEVDMLRAVQQSGSAARRRVARRSPSRRTAKRILAHWREHQHDRYQGAPRTRSACFICRCSSRRTTRQDRVAIRTGAVCRNSERGATRDAAAAPPRDGGFSYVVAPDGVLFELTGGPGTRDAFSHIHFYHEQPLCAANWYVEHLGMELPADARLERKGDAARAVGSVRRAIRRSRLAVSRADRNDSPTVGERSLRQRIRCRGIRDSASVTGAGAIRSSFRRAGRCSITSRFRRRFRRALCQLRRDGVKFLEAPHAFGDTRAFMIEDPDGLAIELVSAPSSSRP